MYKSNQAADSEIPLTELRRQLDYAQTISGDIFRIYSKSVPDCDSLITEYAAVRTKLSMILDFLFQAKLWCDIIEENKGQTQNVDIKVQRRVGKNVFGGVYKRKQFAAQGKPEKH